MMKLIVITLAVVAGFVGLSRGSSPTVKEGLRQMRPSNEPSLTVGLLPQGAKLGTPQTAEQEYKNIQLFKGMAASELDPTMAFISGSLGVRCTFCHVANAFEKDDKPTKVAARKMIQMVFDLNKGSFNGENAVSCFTCHRGKSKPVAVPAVGENLWAPAPPKTEPPAPPSVDQILDNYVQAIGGDSEWQKIQSRVMKGSRIGADGVLVPEEVYQKAPNKLLTITSYPRIVFTNGFNGTSGWGHSSTGGVQQLSAEALNQLKTQAVFDQEIAIKSLYKDLRVAGRDKIGDRDVWIIVGTPTTGSPEKLYFDAINGLLLRKYFETKTALGRLPLQTDYDDYRAVDGIKLPFMIRWYLPGRSWGRKVAEIKHNVAIDDSKFELPKTRP
jgi:zinc protease